MRIDLYAICHKHMPIDCIFCKIVNKEIPAKIVYEDDDVIVFPDIRPVKPVHLLIVIKKHIPDLLELSDEGLWAKILGVIKRQVKDQKLMGKGFRIVINGSGAQAIDHLHFHLMGPMSKDASM